MEKRQTCIFEIEASFVEKLKQSISEVPNEILMSIVKKIDGGRVKSYHPAIKTSLTGKQRMGSLI